MTRRAPQTPAEFAYQQRVERGRAARETAKRARNEAANLATGERTKAVALLANPGLDKVLRAGETEMARREKAAAETRHSEMKIAAENQRVFQAFADECKRGRRLRSFHDTCDKTKNRLDPPNSVSHIKAVLNRMDISRENWREIPLDWERLAGT